MKQEATIKLQIPENSDWTVADVMSALKKVKIKAECTSIFCPIKLRTKSFKKVKE